MFILKHMLRNEAAESEGGGGDNSLYTSTETTGVKDTIESKPTETKIDWNSENWKDYLDEDVKTDPSLKAIKDLKALGKSYVHSQKMIGADKIILPNKYATETEWENIYNKLGRPEASDKYELKFGEETPVSEEFTKSLKDSMFQAGLNQTQAAKVADFWENQVKTSKAQIEASEKARVEEEIGGLKKEWGNSYESKIKAATVAIETFGGKEMFQYLEEAGLHTDTKLARLFAKIGESLVEDGIATEISRDSLKTPVDIEKEIGEIMANPAYFDVMHPSNKALVDRATTLFAQKSKK